MFAFFFFNDTATTEIYTLSLHDALPIYDAGERATLGRDAERTGDERLETARRREGQRHAVPTVDEPEHVRPEHRDPRRPRQLRESRLAPAPPGVGLAEAGGEDDGVRGAHARGLDECRLHPRPRPADPDGVGAPGRGCERRIRLEATD